MPLVCAVGEPTTPASLGVQQLKSPEKPNRSFKLLPGMAVASVVCEMSPQKLWLIAVALIAIGGQIHCTGFEGLKGRYCGSRSDPCCHGRYDDCSVPVYGTLCYCDEFCNRTRTDDCCPDYWSVCLNIPDPTPLPTIRCYAGGRYYEYGEEVKINCNKCKCSRPGELTCEQNTCLLDENLISSVNSDRDLGWRAANYSAFWGRTLSDGITLRTGTLKPHQTVKSMRPIIVKITQPIPASFDARRKWPGLVADSLDQGWCGSSWAVSTVAVASDRFGIMSAGQTRVTLSAQQLLSCNDRRQLGCEGGYLSRAWLYIRKFGLVNEECYPWVGSTDGRCRLPRKTTLAASRCPPSAGQPFRKETYKVGPPYRMEGERDIMHEIMTSGPVQATLKVYQDLFSYRSGIYRKSYAGTSTAFGYHSVRIIGWGEDYDMQGRPVKYWLAYNSWGPYWGENGLFKIARGTNECEIEDFVLAAWTKEPVVTPSAGPNRESNFI